MRIYLIFLLLALPTTALSGGNPQLGKSKVALCVGCHGTDGNSTSTDYPKLASQGEEYLIKQITDFKTGARVEDYMTPMAETVKNEDIADIAAYFSSLPIKTASVKNVNTEQGEKIYTTGIASKGLAACVTCHGEDGKGIPLAKFPSIANQIPEYTAKTLKDFRGGVRHNDPQKMMQTIANKLSDVEISALSVFVANMK